MAFGCANGRPPEFLVYVILGGILWQWSALTPAAGPAAHVLADRIAIEIARLRNDSNSRRLSYS
jgi:hypothetical protein